MSIERLTVVLDSAEAAALRSAARADLRRPQEQARFLLRQALRMAETGAHPTAAVPDPFTNSKRAEVVEAGGALAS